MEQQFAKFMIKELKDKLLDGYAVSIKGLGSFSVVHEKQTQQQDKAGRVTLIPPADRVRFTQES